jgi:hypothetical protein
VAASRHTKSLLTPLANTCNKLPQLSSKNINKHWKHSRGLTIYLILKMWVKRKIYFNTCVLIWNVNLQENTFAF